MIYLYGDSFVENEPAERLGMRDHERWYDMLSQEMNEEHIIYDEKNTYSEVFSKSMQSFRQLVSSSIPSRILIN